MGFSLVMVLFLGWYKGSVRAGEFWVVGFGLI